MNQDELKKKLAELSTKALRYEAEYFYKESSAGLDLPNWKGLSDDTQTQFMRIVVSIREAESNTFRPQ